MKDIKENRLALNTEGGIIALEFNAGFCWHTIRLTNDEAWELHDQLARALESFCMEGADAAGWEAKVIGGRWEDMSNT